MMEKIELTPEFLKKNGKPEFVVLPYEQFVLLEQLLEDWRDLQALRQAGREEGTAETVTLAEVKDLLGLSS